MTRDYNTNNNNNNNNSFISRFFITRSLKRNKILRYSKLTLLPSLFLSKIYEMVTMEEHECWRHHISAAANEVTCFSWTLSDLSLSTFLAMTLVVIAWFKSRIILPEECAFLDYCAACSGKFLQTFRDNLSMLSSGVKDTRRLFFLLGFLTLERWANRLSRNVGKVLPLHAA